MHVICMFKYHENGFNLGKASSKRQTAPKTRRLQSILICVHENIKDTKQKMN